MLQLASGLLLLIVGAEFLVRAAVRIAARLRVRPLMIGLSVVALGSSAPQLAVSVQATLALSPDLAVGSVVGGTLFNLLVTLGLSALIVPLRVSRQLVRIDIPMMIGASLLVLGLGWDGTLGHYDALVLLLGLAVYIAVLLRQSRHSIRPAIASPLNTPGPVARPWLRDVNSAVRIVVGLALLTYGGQLLVTGASDMALELGLSERIVGLSVIAISASVPELATSLIAALRGERDIAVGNVIGSVLFNLLGVLGVTALIAPTPLSISPNALSFDLPIMLGVCALCLPMFYTGLRVTRAEGALLIGLYGLYAAYVALFTTGMPQAQWVQKTMFYGVLPALAAYLAFGAWRLWRRKH